MSATDPTADWLEFDAGEITTGEIIYIDPETRARRWRTYLAVHSARTTNATEQPIPLPRDGQPALGLWQDSDPTPVLLFTDEDELAELSPYSD